MVAKTASRHVVVGVDGSALSTAAVIWAAREAHIHGLPLMLVYVTPTLPIESEAALTAAEIEAFTEAEHTRARELLEQACETAARSITPDGAPIRQAVAVLDGPVLSTLVELSREAALMVVGSRGLGTVSRALLGSVSTGLTHHAQCPVAIVHSNDGDGPDPSDGPVVVGVDGSPTSESATALAFEEAHLRGVDLVAVHAWSDMGPIGFPPSNWSPIEWRNIKEREEKLLTERLGEWRRRFPTVTVFPRVVCDQPAPRLLEAAQGAQLLVVGSRGRGGFAGLLLGSVSATVAGAATVPVIVVPADKLVATQPFCHPQPLE
ncbi:universal stress protein [Mycolicibacterium tokaiense]|uniref:Universal stress protein UspA-like protein n=1 Tax=Mycolicibacterium tokaiense TaxID=39695 RepID=A0A378TNM8_9MYCO|nr:universal stress protein [Mycolicibacterium tokaiense]BBY89249.1 universal stress protein [Mycolicibacterium tokaiense]STZ62361.1 universal stress protein UspA-like protein [Mycolicibacterium tokaiense]